MFEETEQDSEDNRHSTKDKKGCCTLGKMAADYDSENKRFTTFFGQVRVSCFSKLCGQILCYPAGLRGC